MKPEIAPVASDAAAAGVILMMGFVLAASGQAIASNGSTSNAEALVGLGASALGLVIVAWWLLTMTLAAVAALLHAAGQQRAARWAGAAAPAFMRRLALAVLGATLAVGPAAHAAEPPLDPAWQATAPLEVSSDNVAPSAAPADTRDDVQDHESTVQPEAWAPRIEPTAPGPLARPELRTTARPPSAVEVRPGDSLWSIAARHLGPGANAVDVAEAWPRWFEANRAVIGDNPDLLRPGQLLVPPN
ncbi:LysM peptidoglycan-binding domain-containing protein [Sinomonas terrae]|uniref:LysM peptidoglycan-binding domain-containing protein n=1 Tax=Sinomonas terrae TaxID=2908838 RepID=A0ABS9U004_9MICC|nr:LysM peptidoglycan-binding domain-containing protein [Sinomonas terrae]MCH6469645.1 LysM peptidoglycan-binding domain-containing protein [Sinomonas terrae]